ncbi:hypothetical protein [Streptomyces sp. NPDC056660]|uniref:hypothetical protein n=1 Tax=Streptomyces sp. NPDC056660 TaxID=3345897 RepID=UPI003698AECE
MPPHLPVAGFQHHGVVAGLDQGVHGERVGLGGAHGDQDVVRDRTRVLGRDQVTQAVGSADGRVA